MATYELQPDEVILYEGNVTCKTYKGSLQLTLTSQKVVFEKEKGLFKKERELVDVIPLESVKLYNDAAQIKQKGEDVEVQTVGKNITIVFSGMLEARKFTAKIVNAVTGTTLATRGSNMIKDVFALLFLPTHRVMARPQSAHFRKPLNKCTSRPFGEVRVSRCKRACTLSKVS